jgi:transcription antitermination factor NusG
MIATDNIAGALSGMARPLAEPPWFALKVRTGFEKIATAALRHRGYDPFCPAYQERKRYCDRVKTVERLVFPGYMFCQFQLEKKLPVISSPAVEYIVAFGGRALPVPEEEVEAIRRMVESGARPCGYLTVGQRVRIEDGPLAGIEGILVRGSDGSQVVVSIELLQRSVAVRVGEECVSLLQ